MLMLSDLPSSNMPEGGHLMLLWGLNAGHYFSLLSSVSQANNSSM
jgi:hypothetical protein